MRRDRFVAPECQVETDLPIETDGGEVSGVTKGEATGRKLVGGDS